MDYVLSPVKNCEGIFLTAEKLILPENGSANGAYNIIRKGFMTIEKIRDAADDTLKKTRICVKPHVLFYFLNIRLIILLSNV